MSIDELPMDELDRAIRREADALRHAVESSAHTDDAWDDFVVARSATVIQLDDRRQTHTRWRAAAGLGMVAALVATVIVVRELRGEEAPNQPPGTGTTTIAPPPPSTTAPPGTGPGASGYVALAFQRLGHLVAFPADGGDPVDIGDVPYTYSGNAAVSIDVSPAGWVAETGVASEGFWFYRLEDPAGTRRFVELAGWPGGHQSRGAWSPDGTLYASVELGETPVIIDPATENITRLPARVPSFSYPPSWTADGTGLLGGEMPTVCRAPELDRSTLAIIPIDGGPAEPIIPALAGDMDRIVFGPWMEDDGCVPARSARQLTSSEVVIIDLPGEFVPKRRITTVAPEALVRTTWIDGSDVEPLSLLATAFNRSASGLWALTERPGTPRVFDLYGVDAPHELRQVNTIDLDTPAGTTVTIVAVAPDDSAVVVQAQGTLTVRRTYVVPTDGSAVVEVDGDFAGFAPASLVVGPAE